MKLELQEAAAEQTRNYIHWRELFQGGYYQEEKKKGILSTTSANAC